MKERPILFSGPMVRAILEGRKSQTRRIMREQPRDSGLDPKRQTRDTVHFGFPGDQDEEHPLARMGAWQMSGWYEMFPYGKVGDLLWVRETFYPAFRREGHSNGCVYRADDNGRDLNPGWSPNGKGGGWKPSIFMPRWASRLTLRITGVRVERLQEISEADAKAEGAMFHDGHGVGHSGWRYDYKDVYPEARSAYAWLWESINGEGTWHQSPWVWVIEFERIEQQARAA